MDPIVKSLIIPVRRQFSYTCYCHKHVEQLRFRILTLSDVSQDVRQRMEYARLNNLMIPAFIHPWLDSVEYEIDEAEEFLQRVPRVNKTCCTLMWCGYWRTLHRSGRRAADLTEKVERLMYDGRKIVWSDDQILQDLVEFDTQKSTLEEIIKHIKDESIQIIGIYGLGGVGKTTLVRKASLSVQHEYKVIFNSVSNETDVQKVQNTIEGIAEQILKGDKILIILDNMRNKLMLEELSFPSETDFKKSKILLISRSKDVCIAMNAQRIICVNPLRENEAWSLFKHVAGQEVEKNQDLNDAANKIVKECDGLPLTVKSVGETWKLQARNMDAPTLLQVHSTLTYLKIMYDKVQSEEAKLCFLLCRMFPKDDDIPLDRLAHYFISLIELDKFSNMEDTRRKVEKALNVLKASYLSLNEDNKFTTKLHHVVHDLVPSIISKDKEKFFAEAGKGLTKWEPEVTTSKKYTMISLMKNRIKRLPDYELRFPSLKTLTIQENHKLSVLPEKFIAGIKEVRVLDMECNRISTLPQSFTQLKKLRMLNLAGNKDLHEISILGELTDLMILVLNRTGIKEIPGEIAQLVNLRRLEVNQCEHLSHIEPNVISMLRCLEELCIGFYAMQVGIYKILVEVKNSSNLTYLDLYVPSVEVIPEGFGSGMLKGFVIQIDGSKHFSSTRQVLYSKRYLILGMSSPRIPFLKLTADLKEVCSDIILQSTEKLKNILPYLYQVNFNKLASIELDECPDITCLVDSSKDLGKRKTTEKFFTNLKHLHLSWLFSLEVLWNCPDQYISLTNLVTLSIVNCHMLVRVFSEHVAQGLVNLQELHLGYLIALEEVIWGGDVETDTSEIQIVEQAPKMKFPSLARISLENLPILKSFHSGYSNIEYPSLEKVNIRRCANMKIWGHGIHETPKLNVVGDVSLLGPDAINDAVAKCNENDQGAMLR